MFILSGILKGSALGPICKIGYISQGSVLKRKKGPGSRCQWTWKNRDQKTESLTLTPEQYRWLQQAITNERKLKKTLKEMRRIAEPFWLDPLVRHHPFFERRHGQNRTYWRE